jgi:hypothetical protein
MPSSSVAMIEAGTVAANVANHSFEYIRGMRRPLRFATGPS